MANNPPKGVNKYTWEQLSKLPMFDQELIKKAQQKRERRAKRKEEEENERKRAKKPKVSSNKGNGSKGS